MLFKTKDNRTVEKNGFVYIELPTIFYYEITQKKTLFSGDLIILDSAIKVMPKWDTTDNLEIPEGTKHLFFEKEGKEHDYFFLENGWLMDAKGKTVETL